MFNFLIKNNISNHAYKNTSLHKILLICNKEIDLRIFDKIQLKGTQ